MKIRVTRLELVALWLSIVSAGAALAIDSIWLNIAISSMVYLFLINKVNYKSSLHVMTLIGFTIFIYAPALLNSIFFDTPFFVYYITALLVMYFLWQTDVCVYKPLRFVKSLYVFLFFLFATLLVAVPVFGNFALFFLSPVIMFYALSLRAGKWGWNLILTFALSASYLLYMKYGWDGYGRTVVFGTLLTGYLYLMYALEIRVPKLVLAIFSVAGVVISAGRKNVSLEAPDIEFLLNDSAVGPYRLASTFINDYEFKGIDIYGFFQQILFVLFSFIPRELWQSKPFGFGFEYVVQNMDRSLIDAGHSIAPTLAGDHIYFLGFFGILTALFMIHCVGRMALYFHRLKYFHGFAVILISTNMMVLIWGGMASFSARIIHPLISMIPILMLYFVYDRLIRPGSVKSKNSI